MSLFSGQWINWIFHITELKFLAIEEIKENASL